MTYKLILMPEAERHLKEWSKFVQKKTLKNIADLFDELRQHPTTGTGHVEPLKGNLPGSWSREINKENRMIYSIEDDKVIVNFVSLKGHYGDK